MRKLISFIIVSLLFISNLIAQEVNDEKLVYEIAKIRERNLFHRDFLHKVRKSYLDKLKHTTDSAVIKELNQKIDQNYVLEDLGDEKEVEAELTFVNTHLNSPLSLKILNDKIKRYAAIKYYAQFNDIFKKMPSEIQNSENGKILDSILKIQKNSAIGAIASDFSFEDIKGNKLSLSSIYKLKKLVLIDFWASWCAPCIEEFRKLKQINTKYKTNDFEVIAISEDKDFDIWEKTIQKYGIQDWIHTNRTTNTIDFEKLYFRNAIPTTILINNEGKIIGRWRGSGEENLINIEKTISSYFNSKHL